MGDDDDIAPVQYNQTDGSSIVDDTIQDFHDRYNGIGPPFISTGIAALDRAILGLRAGKVYVVAARPGMGKSALSTSIRRAVVDQGFVALEFNLEMGRGEIGERELAFRSEVNLRKLMAAQQCSPDELERVGAVRGSVPKGLWWVWDDVFDMDGVVEHCRQAKRRADHEGKKVGLIILDYLQLIGGDEKEGRQQLVASCSRRCKMLSKELDCAVVALSQLNRQCDYRMDDKGGHRPAISDLRESGAIEQDSDAVIFIYRHYLYDHSQDPGDAEIIIAKQRAGPLGTIKVQFNTKSVSFSDCPPPPVPATEVIQ